MTKERDITPEEELLSSSEGIGRKLSDQALEDFAQDLVDEAETSPAGKQEASEEDSRDSDNSASMKKTGSDVDSRAENVEKGVSDLQDALKAAEAKASENWDHFVRAQAEMENIRRRAQRDVENAHKYASEKFLQSLLPVIDSLEMGAAAANQKDAALEKIVEGMELTVKMFSDILQKFEIEKMDPTGELFNPELHQAMSMQETADEKPNTIMAVMQKGYRIKDRLIRPAMVVVAKAETENNKKTDKNNSVGKNIDENA